MSMSGREFETIRKKTGLGKREFARAIGLRGANANNWITVTRYENEKNPIPSSMEMLLRVICWTIEGGFGLPPPCSNAMKLMAE